MIKKTVIVLLSWINLIYACTSFGAITKTGTIIGKNRDYIYGIQKFELMYPLKQFVCWYGNKYGHENKFYALISNSDVKFGVNEYGLTAIEEDPLYAGDTKQHRKYYQPYIGYSEGMILYGILQNFKTVTEIIPYLDEIFSTSAPNFYQIADKSSILTVEVAYGDVDDSIKRQFTYKILNKTKEYFVHTNHYLSQEFESLNLLQLNKNLLLGSVNRLDKIKLYVNQANDNFTNAPSWFLDTKSNLGSESNPHWCLNTSIFRSNLQNLTKISLSTKTDTVYGTVSDFIVENKANTTSVHLLILDFIDTLKNKNQKIKYRELNMSLADIFATNKLTFINKSFVRNAPIGGVCN